ncbi:LexA family protein [Gracilibacillus dipsosauri]|uniref:LexA family protein n=1 Tax=Gracilibacillus dipsosauri TaxID=178340 RepID=UPI0024098280
MSVGKRIKERRKELKLSVDEIAKRLGKNRATVYRYEGDEIEDVPVSVIKEIAKVLKTDPGYLMGWKNSKEDLTSENSYYYLPTTISAGVPLEVNGLTENDIEQITLPDSVMGKWAGNKDVFFTKINGESMNKIMPDQSFIAVKKVGLNDLKNGDIVVFSDSHEYGVKRFYLFDNRVVFRPESTDPRITDYQVTDLENLNIYGKVVLFIVEN